MALPANDASLALYPHTVNGNEDRQHPAVPTKPGERTRRLDHEPLGRRAEDAPPRQPFSWPVARQPSSADAALLDYSP